jgi:hypothetical protein
MHEDAHAARPRWLLRCAPHCTAPRTEAAARSLGLPPPGEAHCGPCCGAGRCGRGQGRRRVFPPAGASRRAPKPAGGAVPPARARTRAPHAAPAPLLHRGAPPRACAPLWGSVTQRTALGGARTGGRRDWAAQGHRCAPAPAGAVFRGSAGAATRTFTLTPAPAPPWAMPRTLSRSAPPWGLRRRAKHGSFTAESKGSAVWGGRRGLMAVVSAGRTVSLAATAPPGVCAPRRHPRPRLGRGKYHSTQPRRRGRAAVAEGHGAARNRAVQGRARARARPRSWRQGRHPSTSDSWTRAAHSCLRSGQPLSHAVCAPAAGRRVRAARRPLAAGARPN